MFEMQIQVDHFSAGRYDLIGEALKTEGLSISMTRVICNEGQREQFKKCLHNSHRGKHAEHPGSGFPTISVSPAGMAPLHLTDVLDGQSPVGAPFRWVDVGVPTRSGMSSSGQSLACLVARTPKVSLFP